MSTSRSCRPSREGGHGDGWLRTVGRQRPAGRLADTAPIGASPATGRWCRPGPPRERAFTAWWDAGPVGAACEGEAKYRFRAARLGAQQAQSLHRREANGSGGVSSGAGRNGCVLCSPLLRMCGDKRTPACFPCVLYLRLCSNRTGSAAVGPCPLRRRKPCVVVLVSSARLCFEVRSFMPTNRRDGCVM